MSSMYNALEENVEEKTPNMAIIWRNVGPQRVQFFGWLAFFGRERTFDLLIRMVVIIVQNVGLCCLLVEILESVYHTFFLCGFSWKIWLVCLDRWGVSWATPAGIVSTIICRRVEDNLVGDTFQNLMDLMLRSK